MSRPSDWRQRQAALDPRRSFIVQAPAGSGKTELLTQRLMRLLAAVENPEEVVAITFTRKAAAEMSHRLLQQLRRATQPVDEDRLAEHERLGRQLAVAVLENDRRRGWDLLRQPGRLRVRTIDSLCGELGRQLPLLSGLGGGQQLLEDANALYRQAALRALSAIEDPSDVLCDDVRRILERYNNAYDRLADLLTALLGNRDQWLEFLLRCRSGHGFDRTGMEHTLSYLVQRELEQALALLPGWLVEELPAFLAWSLENAPDDEAQVQALLREWGGEGRTLRPGTEPEQLAHWLTLTDRLLTKGGDWLANPLGRQGFPAPSGAAAPDRERFRQWKDDYRALLDRLRAEDALCEQLQLLRKLPRPHYDDEAWTALESLNRILLRAVAEWKLVMAASGGADFTEIANRAIQALGEEDAPSELALRLDYRVAHLLVDEFQDTSHNQIRLLERLTAGWSAGDGRSLFLVGDPMQSIYRFRKAEVSLFIQAFEGGSFTQLQLEPLKLSVNFRSTAPVVDWVNRVFPGVMPATNDTVTGAVSYSPAQTRPDAGEDGEVHCHVMACNDDEAEARAIVERIRDAAPEERLAILVRARKHAAATLALLDRLKQDDARFRYRAIQITPLAETPLVRDLLSLTLALCQPADRLSWFSILRAPFVGLGLADLDALAGDTEAAVLPDAIARCLDGTGAVLPAGGQARLQRSGPLLLEAAAQCHRLGVRDVVESTWTRLGGPACLRNRSELLDADTYLDLLSALQREGLPVDRDTLEQRLGELYAEPDADAGERLQVMTIFAAKGLQFDTVILPGLNKGTGNDAGRLLHWFEVAEIDGFVMCPMRDEAEKERRKRSGDLIQYISNIESRRQSMENGRLLYVAATRAVSRLYLFGAAPPDARVRAKPGSLLAALWPVIEAEQLLRVRAQADALAESPPGASPAGPKPLPQVHLRLADGWHTPEAPESVAVPCATTFEESDYIEFQWAGEDARLTGDLVHRLLQVIAEEGAAAWIRRDGMTAMEVWCRHQLQSEGVRGNKADAIIERTARAVANCLDTETGRWILAPHEEAACEYAITAMLDGQPVNLVLDRTFVEDGVRWIIDYKSSTHSGGGLEEFLQNEKDRYRAQLERYRAALALTETRPIRTALYLPLLDRLVEV